MSSQMVSLPVHTFLKLLKNMLELSYISTHSEEVKERLRTRRFKHPEFIDRVVKLDDERRKIQQIHDGALEKLNKVSKEIGVFFKEGKQDLAKQAKEESANLKEDAKELNEKQLKIQEELHELLIKIPNVPNKLVPRGSTADDNEIVKQVGELPKMDGSDSPHWELAKNLDIFDLELGVKITGAGFPVYMGYGAKLQRSLINFFLESAIEAGYKEIIPPLMVNEETAFATGQLPDKEGQMYEMKADPFFLIPTAEVPLTNIYRNVILKEEEFPVKLAGYTPCFRREAGSYGKDVRGLNRVHQFDKVEIVQIQHPEKSYDTLDEMIAHVETLLQRLELPYRIARLCGGDLGFTSALTYDMEVYSAAQKRWLEVSSISNFETFQSNRLKLRFKDENKKNKLAHTLNGSALALPRIVAALLENNQQNGEIVIPDALHPFTGFEKITK